MIEKNLIKGKLYVYINSNSKDIEIYKYLYKEYDKLYKFLNMIDNREYYPSLNNVYEIYSYYHKMIKRIFE